jgi:hypothetical protein
MEEFWYRLRSLGVLKPEYDHPISTFGTVLERGLEHALDGLDVDLDDDDDGAGWDEDHE